MQRTLMDQDLHFLMKVQPFVLKEYHCYSPYYTKAIEIISSLSEVVGFDVIAAVINLQMNGNSEHVRDMVARVIGIIDSSQASMHPIIP